MAETTLSIIIPVYNEEATVQAVLDRVVAVDLGDVRKEIIIVDDGSRDRSSELIDAWVKAFSSDDGTTVEAIHKANGGKGSAVQAGRRLSTGDVLIIQDADLESNPEDFRQCIAPIIAGKAEVVYGSRERFSESQRQRSLIFYAGGLTVTYWINLLYGSSLTDAPTCYKTFRGGLIRALPIEGDGFDWEPEVTGKLLRLGYEIEEAPIGYQPRQVDEGKKITWRDGLEALWTALIWRVRPLRGVRQALSNEPLAAEQMKSMRRDTQWLWSIVALAFLARLLISLPGLLKGDMQTFMRLDSWIYLNASDAFLETGGFYLTPAATTPLTIVPFGYPLYLSVIRFLTLHYWQAQVIIFALIGALACVPVFKVGRLWGGRAVAILAAGLLALNLTAIAHSPLYLTDTFYLLIVGWQLFFFLRFIKLERLIDLWLAVGVAALSTLVRGPGLLWIIPCLFIVLIYPRKPLKKRLIGAAGAILIYLVVLTPWMYRNAVKGGAFALETNSGVTLLYHNVPAMLSKMTGEPAPEIRARFMAEIDAAFAQDPEQYATPAAQNSLRVERAMGYIRANPVRYFREHLQPLVLLPDAPTFLELLGMTQTGQGTLDVLHREGLLAAVNHYFGDRRWLLLPLLPLLAIIGITYLGCALQFGHWIWRLDWFMFFVVMGTVTYFLFLPGPVIMPRYHLPALPMICLMAALCLTAGWRAWRARRSAAA